MKQLITYLLILISQTAVAAWTPPVKPDPKIILNEARDDALAEEYETALAKHVWFHNNALKYKESLYGVRLSFALRDWIELGKKYPPALEKLKVVRDKSCREVKTKTKPHQYFHDCSSINEYINEHHITVELFFWIEKNNPQLAKRFYSIAEKSLIKGKQYKICGKYIAPRATYDNTVNNYHRDLEYSRDERFQKFAPEIKIRIIEHAESRFLKDVATLIALLVHNDRKKEAEIYYKEALVESESPNTDRILNKALKGIFPNGL